MNSAIRLVESFLVCDDFLSSRLEVIAKKTRKNSSSKKLTLLSHFGVCVIYLILFLRASWESFRDSSSQRRRGKKIIRLNAKSMQMRSELRSKKGLKNHRVREGGEKLKWEKISSVFVNPGRLCSAVEEKRFVINHYLLKLFTQAQFP